MASDKHGLVPAEGSMCCADGRDSSSRCSRQSSGKVVNNGGHVLGQVEPTGAGVPSHKHAINEAISLSHSEPASMCADRATCY